MGLFTKKDPCAICGGKVKALLPWRIEGQLVCNECHGVVDLPDGVENQMTLEEFRTYRSFREENQKLQQQFQITQQVDFGWLDTKIVFDTNHRLMCMDKGLGKTIFEGHNIKSFSIREDEEPLFEGSEQGLFCYVSSVPNRVKALKPVMDQFRMQAQIHADMENMIDRIERLDGVEDDQYHYNSSPSFNIEGPFKKFYVELQMDHPYWTSFSMDKNAPTFNGSDPSIRDYLDSYKESVTMLEQLARTLKAIAFPDAPEQTIDLTDTSNELGGNAVAASAPVDAVEEIQRYKSLMDQGIITEEEFTAKKRKLLDI